MCVLDVPDRFLQSIGNRQDGEIEGSDKRTMGKCSTHTVWQTCL